MFGPSLRSQLGRVIKMAAESVKIDFASQSCKIQTIRKMLRYFLYLFNDKVTNNVNNKLTLQRSAEQSQLSTK